MVGSSSARERLEHDLEARGYRIVISGYDWASTDFPNDTLLHHRPCGQGVFDPDTHDSICLAKE